MKALTDLLDPDFTLNDLTFHIEHVMHYSGHKALYLASTEFLVDPLVS